MLETDRLLLRQWRADDLDEWAALNADPEVMATIGPIMSRDAAAIWLGHNQARIALRGWGLWAVEVKDGPAFIGFVGLNPPSFEAHFTPCVEVGWRLARSAWGNGYATEGGRAAIAFGFESLGLDEIVSFTATSNERSRAVMERLGMTRDPADDFVHPNLDPSHPLSRHVLYRLGKSQWNRPV